MSQNGAIYRNGKELAGVSQDPIHVVALSKNAVCDANGLNIKDNYKKKVDTSNPGLLDSAGYHNSMFRGQDITDRFKDGSLYADIASGAFTNLFIGDYFNVEYNNNVIKCRLAGFDINCLLNGASKHHAVIVPDECIINSKWNDTSTTDGGYKDSKAHNECESIINPWLDQIHGLHLIEYRDYLTTGIDAGASSGESGLYTGITISDSLETIKSALMTEYEILGSRVYSSSGLDQGLTMSQLPLFHLSPEFVISNTLYYWTRCICDKSSVVAIHNSANCVNPWKYNTTNELGIRPKWLIG